MATTGNTLIGVFNGSTFAAAFSNPSSLDVVQIINEGGKVVWSLDHTGVVATNPSSPTTESLMRYFGSSFATAFTNPSNIDLLQIYGEGENLVFHVDYLGAAHTP